MARKALTKISDKAKTFRPSGERANSTAPAPAFRTEWQKLISGIGAMRLLAVIALGTMGFGMADVLLEPYGGHVLNMSVAETTRLTAVLAAGGLIGFAWASRVLGRGSDPVTVAFGGALVGVPGFGAIVIAAAEGMIPMFLAGTLAVGFGAGLFGHGTLTATMRRAPREQTGLALGAWGAVQATAAGVAVAIGGGIRDVIVAVPGGTSIETPYIAVFGLEIVLLILALVVVLPLRAGTRAEQVARKADVLRDMDRRRLEEA